MHLQLADKTFKRFSLLLNTSLWVYTLRFMRLMVPITYPLTVELVSYFEKKFLPLVQIFRSRKVNLNLLDVSNQNNVISVFFLLWKQASGSFLQIWAFNPYFLQNNNKRNRAFCQNNNNKMPYLRGFKIPHSYLLQFLGFFNSPRSVRQNQTHTIATVPLRFMVKTITTK